MDIVYRAVRSRASVRKYRCVWARLDAIGSMALVYGYGIATVVVLEGLLWNPLPSTEVA
jgi:hypothetical protein